MEFYAAKMEHLAMSLEHSYRVEGCVRAKDAGELGRLPRYVCAGHHFIVGYDWLYEQYQLVPI